MGDEVKRLAILLSPLVLTACDETRVRTVEVPVTLTCGEKPVDMPVTECVRGDHERCITETGVYIKRLQTAVNTANDRIAACNGEQQLNDRKRELDARLKGL